MRLAGSSETHVTSIDNVATRNRYYRRTRPHSGEKIDDVEWSLSVLEDKVAPVIRTLACGGEWPLAREPKAKLAELFAFQLLRGPRWQAWAERRSREVLEREGLARPLDTERLTLMLRLGHPVATLLGSMQWLLLEFRSPVVATSDQPIVVWPLELHARDPREPAPAFGFKPFLEVRVPLSPRLAIVMTWADEDDRGVLGTHEQAANLNAFTVAQADRQWFHLPGAVPPRAAGRLLPLAPRLVSGYGVTAVAASRRRAEATRYARDGLDKPLSERGFWMVEVHEQTA